MNNTLQQTNSTNCAGDTERDRFVSILNRALKGGHRDKSNARTNLAEYLRFSRQRDNLIDTLIKTCTISTSPYRLDFAIDILAMLDGIFQSYARSYLETEIQQSNRYTGKWQPDQDYWHVLLSALAKCTDKAASLTIVSACQDESEMGIAESVVDALAEIETPEAKSLLQSIGNSHSNQLIKDLAQEYLEEWN